MEANFISILQRVLTLENVVVSAQKQHVS